MFDLPPNITVVGAGRLAWNLIPSLQKAGLRVSAIFSRTEDTAALFSETFHIPLYGTDFRNIPEETDLVFLTVGDQAIEEVSAQISGIVSPQTILVHTSGSTPLNALRHRGPVGVFYPLQTFTRHSFRDFADVPVFAEGSPDALRTLLPVAKAVSGTVQLMDSEERLRLHLGAVLVNNFTNYLYKIAAELNPKTDFSVFRPLISGHMDNVFSRGPALSQTGPAVREDITTLQKHLQLLDAYPEIASLYRQISVLIQPNLSTRI
ncbi:MAG: DUF2520 domain-containing protein [Bacteroidia bacterium]